MISTPLKLASLVILGLSSVASAENAGDIAQTAMTELMINKNVEAVDNYFAEPYIQHNQSVPTGLAALKGLADQAIAQNPAFDYDMIRFFSDGDIGVAHGIYTGFGPEPLVAFDVFRVENGKIVEHWDNVEV
ncbi:MAG: nuclear transport factor 2 family protein, partial [Pseudomonadota bacterium]